MEEKTQGEGRALEVLKLLDLWTQKGVVSEEATEGMKKLITADRLPGLTMHLCPFT